MMSQLLKRLCKNAPHSVTQTKTNTIFRLLVFRMTKKPHYYYLEWKTLLEKNFRRKTLFPGQNVKIIHR